MSKTRELAPWEPDPKWSPQATEAFVTYRDMGPERSTAKVARALGKTKTLMDRWSRRDAWVERSAQWDGECDRVRREEFTSEGAHLGEKLAKDAEALREALLAPAKAVAERIVKARAKGEDPFEGVTNAEMIRLSATAGRAFAQVAHVERLAHGQSTGNLGGHDGGPIQVDVADKSPAEITAYLAGREDALRESMKVEAE